MSKSKKFLRIFKRHTKSLSTVLGVVMVWRGVWHLLDAIDNFLFGGSHVWTLIIGVVIGLAILLIPDNDLKEIEQR